MIISIIVLVALGGTAYFLYEYFRPRPPVQPEQIPVGLSLNGSLLASDVIVDGTFLDGEEWGATLRVNGSTGTLLLTPSGGAGGQGTLEYEVTGFSNESGSLTMNIDGRPVVLEWQESDAVWGVEFNGYYVASWIDDARNIWLRNAIQVSKTSPLMQGWLYYDYSAWYGDLEGDGWTDTVKRSLGDTPGSTSSPLGMLYVEGSTIRNSEGPFFMKGCSVRGVPHNPAQDGKYDDWYTYRAKDAANIKSLGFNTIRLVVYWEELETSTSPAEFTYNEQYIERLRQTVEEYNRQGIYVIIDLHQSSRVNDLSRFIPTAGNDMTFASAFYSDASPTSAREHLKNVWLRLSQTFRDNPGVMYELLNEPHHVGTLTAQQVSDYWFGIAEYVTSSLRGAGDDHIVVIDFGPSARFTGYMSAPIADGNAVYSVHFYQGIDEERLIVIDNGFGWLKTVFERDVNARLAEFNVPYIMGEQGFGTYQEHDGSPDGPLIRGTISQSTFPGLEHYDYVELRLR